MAQDSERRPPATNAGILVEVCRTAPRTTPTLPYGPRSGPPRFGRYSTPWGSSTTRESSCDASSRRGRHPATSTGPASTTSISSGEPAAGWPTSKVRVGDTPRVTAADGSGYESGRAEVHLLGPLSRMCRGDSRLVRRLEAGTQPATGAEERGHGSKGNNVQSKQPFRMKRERKRRTHRA
jgi:hypothetical protein